MDLLSRYARSHYQIGGAYYDLADQAVPYSLPKRWVIITACNPHSQPLSELQNKKRTNKMYIQLLQKGYEPEPVEAGWGTWWEQSFFVPYMPLYEALDLAREFEQSAILFGTGRRAALVFTQPLRVKRYWLKENPAPYYA